MVQLIKNKGLNAALVGSLQRQTGIKDGDFIPCDSKIGEVKAEITSFGNGVAHLSGDKFNSMIGAELRGNFINNVFVVNSETASKMGDGCPKINTMLRLIGHNVIANEDRYGSSFFSYQPVFESLQSDPIEINWVATQKSKNGLEKVHTIRKVWDKSKFIHRISGDLIPSTIGWDSTIILLNRKKCPFNLYEKEFDQLLEKWSIKIQFCGSSGIGGSGDYIAENVLPLLPNAELEDTITDSYNLYDYVKDGKLVGESQNPFHASIFGYVDNFKNELGKNCQFIFGDKIVIAPFSAESVSEIFGSYYQPNRRFGIKISYKEIMLFKVKKGADIQLVCRIMDYSSIVEEYCGGSFS